MSSKAYSGLTEPIWLFLVSLFGILIVFGMFHVIYHQYQTKKAAMRAQPALPPKFNPVKVFKKYNDKTGGLRQGDGPILANMKL